MCLRVRARPLASGYELDRHRRPARCTSYILPPQLYRDGSRHIHCKPTVICHTEPVLGSHLNRCWGRSCCSGWSGPALWREISSGECSPLWQAIGLGAEPTCSVRVFVTTFPWACATGWLPDGCHYLQARVYAVMHS